MPQKSSFIARFQEAQLDNLGTLFRYNFQQMDLAIAQASGLGDSAVTPPSRSAPVNTATPTSECAVMRNADSNRNLLFQDRGRWEALNAKCSR